MVTCVCCKDRARTSIVRQLIRFSARQPQPMAARVIGVVLTGMLDDGTAGLMVVSASGGEAIVQDPETALYPSMPRSALNNVPNAKVTPLQEIPAVLLQLIRSPFRAEVMSHGTVPLGASKETRIAELDMSEISSEDRLGQPSAFACPDCGGVLWEIEQNGFLRFRCRVGHALTAKYLGAEQRHAVETALWEALRALEESASLYRRMGKRAAASRHDLPAQQYEGAQPIPRKMQKSCGIFCCGSTSTRTMTQKTVFLGRRSQPHGKESRG